MLKGHMPRDGTRGLRGGRRGEMENRKAGPCSRAIVAGCWPTRGRSRLPDEFDERRLDTPWSHQPRAVRRRVERERLAAVQRPLDRAGSTRAALIPIVKSADWWELTQDERQAIFEEDSHHIAIGHEYLPAVARRLYHCRELGEPFDFLTWFEYAPADGVAFEQLVARVRKTREWDYVVWEIDIQARAVGSI